MKTCSRCDVKQDATCFHRQSQSRDGLSSWCKACHREYRTTYRDRQAAHARRWRAENPDRVRANRIAYRERAAEKQREWREANREKVNAYSRDRLPDGAQRRHIHR
jgi:hypothetical protein